MEKRLKLRDFTHDRRSTDELGWLYTTSVLYGIGSGITLASYTEPDSPSGFILPTLLLASGSVLLVSALDRPHLRYGGAQAITSMLFIGLEAGITCMLWKNEDGSWGGPIGEKVAAAIERGYSNRNEPFHGYFFRVLKGQGPAAPLGQLDFVVKDVMIGGFALIAFPAQYRVTGVQTFIVSHDGVVYQKDLGPKTLELAAAIDRFNPDDMWTVVND